MTAIKDTRPGRWFRRVMWIGIVANVALAIPTLLYPGAMLARNELPAAAPDMWVRFSALLLILLSVFYMPAAVDPDRYRATAWMAIASRLTGVVFFLVLQPAVYRMLGMVDLVFLVPLAILLVAALRRGSPAPRLAGVASS